MPPVFTTVLRYYEEFTLDPPTASITGNYVFSANGMFDPNITSTGHQPRGFDQLMAFYDHYTVTSSKIKVTFQKQAAQQIDNQIVGIVVYDTVPAFTNLTDAIESRRVTYKPTETGGTTSRHSPIILTQSCNMLKQHSTQAVLAKTDLSGTASANPTEQTYYGIFAGANYAGVDATFWIVTALIEYTATFTEPVNPASS